MNLSRNNLFAKYYNWMYDEYPNDICSFFWKTLFILILFPIMVPGRLVTPGYKGSWYSFGNGILMWVGYLFVLVVGAGIMNRFGYVPYGFWGIFLLAPILGCIVIGLGLGIPAGITIGSIATYDKVTSVAVVERTTQKAKDWWGAIRGKYCTKITWK